METLQTVKAQSPDLLTNHIDSRLTKIRPMATPVDQISRHATQRRASSMRVDYYSVALKDSYTTLDEEVTVTKTGLIDISPAKPIFAASDTVLLAHESFENTVTGYVTSADKDSIVIRVSGASEIPAGTRIVRMGRAARELDVTTGCYDGVPTKDYNYCQIFKAQVEHSGFLTLSSKEVGWNITDQEEAAIIDMRMAMERNFLFGNREKYNIDNDDVYTTGGIWNQVTKTHSFDDYDNDLPIEMCRKAFTGNAGSSRKVLIAGSGFIEGLSKLNVNRAVINDAKKTCWGIDFSEIVSKFGTLYVVLSEAFDQCGHTDDALIFDPEYLTKFSHVPFQTEKLDLRAAGTRNVDAVVITEASCLVLRYPDAHLRITRNRV